MHILILGGTTEARALAGLLHAEGRPDLRVTSSLAGRVARPRLPEGEVRIGGFGGVDGLVEWLGGHAVDAVIDATHPFAGRISFNAARAAATAHVPLLALRRPGWVPAEGDRWHSVPSLEAAAETLDGLGDRVFLTTGRMGLATFAGLPQWFLVRSVDAPEGPAPARTELLLDRGPFTLDGERDLLARHRIDVVVTKDSGGAATAPKLTAAREAGLPVVLVRRPPAPGGVPVAETAGEAAGWVSGGFRAAALGG
ncbi:MULTISPECIES: cobalt-precorrin-6A reductase [unclassified Streptomyces]|uniref:cobalt-precorrin-6A reductase n=1 Tax=unclassified Streptomyces TaxID=2593676 RepID=UPI00166091B9|nr:MULTISPECIES: cobalt-precorrin-6A reductase [unclassified Streptomyces]MBD0708993.1 cobalt-precorrin-6A reductase [Streptomyces sp. CBMA291]MBD0716672.1 cobalt-precorrin-6A reductase [Streptomyces sp. CBMA370]